MSARSLTSPAFGPCRDQDSLVRRVSSNGHLIKPEASKGRVHRTANLDGAQVRAAGDSSTRVVSGNERVPVFVAFGILHPYSSARLGWDLFIVLLLIYTVRPSSPPRETRVARAAPAPARRAT